MTKSTKTKRQQLLDILSGHFNRLSLFVILLLSFITSQVYGQSSATYFSPSTEQQYHINHYSNENALKQIIVNGIFLDNSNFLWLMTPSGCVRFDGAQFTYFNSGKGDISRAKFAIKSLFHQDTYYVQFTGSLIGKIVNGAYSTLDKNDNFHLLESFLFEKNPKYPLDKTIFEKDRALIKGFYPIDSKRLYIREGRSIKFIEKGKEIHHYKDLLIKPNAYGSNFKPHAVFQDFFVCLRTDMKMIVLKSGVVHQKINLKSALKGKYKNLNFNEVKFIKNTDNLDAFLCIRGDLYRIENVDQKIKIVPLNINTTIPLISGIEIADNGSKVFISSQSSGLFLLQKKIFSDSYDKDFPRSQSYQTYIELPDGKIITNRSSLIDTDLTTTSVDIDRANSFFRYEGATSYFVSTISSHIYKYQSSDSLELIYEDEGDGQYSNIIMGDDGTFWINRASPKDKSVELGLLKNGTYRTIISDFDKLRSSNWTPKGILQLNSDSIVYLLDTATYSLITQKPPQPLEIRDVLYLNDDLSLLATYNNGLWFSKNGAFKKIEISSSKINESNSLLRDNLGFVWVSTNNGLFRFQEKALETYWDKDYDEIFYDYYDRSYGFSNNEFNGGDYSSSRLLSDGRLSFASVQGIVFVNPSDLTKIDTKASKILIEVEVDNQIIGLDTIGELDPNFQRINFLISTSKFDNSENLHLYYRLIGFEDKWYRYDPDRPISYTQLKGGDYTLETKLLSGPEENEVIYKTLNFYVNKEWHKKVAGLIGLFLLFSLCYYTIYQYRVRYLKAQKQKLEQEVSARTIELSSTNKRLNSIIKVKNKILSIVTHEVVGSVQVIHNTTKYISANEKSTPYADVMDFIGEIKDTSKTTKDLLKNILTWAKTQNEEIKLINTSVKVHQSLNEICQKLKAQANENNIQLINATPEILTITTDINTFTLIMHSLIENQVKHNTNATVRIGASPDSQYDIVISNDNDGGTLDIDYANGFFTSINNEVTSRILVNGLGFWIIKDLLRKSNGQIQFKRESETSHTIEIKVS